MSLEEVEYLAEEHKKRLENDVAPAFKHSKWLFKALGLWSFISESSLEMNKYFSFFMIIFNSFSMMSLISTCAVFAVVVVKETNMKILLMGPTAFKLTCMLKYFSMLFHVDLIKNGFKYVKICWSFAESDEERKVLMKSINSGKKLTIICATFMFSAGIFYALIVPNVKGRKINKFNQTIRPLPNPGFDLIINTQISPNYELVYGLICYASFINYTIVIAACNLAALFETHVIGLIQIVVLRLNNLVGQRNENNNIDIDGHIASVVRCHVVVIKFADLIEKLLREICFVEVILSTMIICLLEYYCLIEWDNNEALSLFTYFLLLASLSFNIFIFCYIGQLLQDERAAYMINWYDVHEKTILALVLIISMAEYPRKMTAGGMVEMCLQSYGETIKSSFVYLNMLRTFAST